MGLHSPFVRYPNLLDHLQTALHLHYAQTIPFERIYPSPHTTRPWIFTSLLSIIKTRKALYSSAWLKGSPENWVAYRSCRNRTLSLFRSAKYHFFHSISSFSNSMSLKSYKKMGKNSFNILTLIYQKYCNTSSQSS